MKHNGDKSSDDNAYNRSLIFVRWLDYSTPRLVRNISNMRYEDRAASLFSGEHVLSQGIYVVGYR